LKLDSAEVYINREKLDGGGSADSVEQQSPD